jgi:uncharacterized lipoprotein YajG
MKILLLLVLVILSGCKTPLEISTNNSPVTAPSPSPLHLEPVEWKVFNRDGIVELSKMATPTTVIYTLDPSNFEHLNKNLLELRRYILEQNQAVEFYKSVQN